MRTSSPFDQITPARSRPRPAPIVPNQPAWWVGLSADEFYRQARTRFPAVNDGPIYADPDLAMEAGLKRRTA